MYALEIEEAEKDVANWKLEYMLKPQNEANIDGRPTSRKVKSRG